MRTLKLLLFLLLFSSVTNAQKFYLYSLNDSAKNAPGLIFIYDSINGRYHFFTSHSDKERLFQQQNYVVTDIDGSILKMRTEYFKSDTAYLHRNAFMVTPNNFLYVGIKVKNGSYRTMYIRNMDSNLAIISEKSISFADTTKKFVTFLSTITAKNTLLVAGTVKSDTSVNYKMFLHELSTSGDSLRYGEFGTMPDTFGFCYHVVERVDTAGYIMVNDYDVSNKAMYYVDTNFVLQRKSENKFINNVMLNTNGWVSIFVSLLNGSFVQSCRASYKNKHWHYLLKYRDDMTYVNYAVPPSETDTAADFGHMQAYTVPLAYSPQGGIYTLEGTRTDGNGYLNFNNNYALVCRFDTSLNLLWSRFLGGDGYNYIPISIFSAENGSCMVLCARRNLDTLAPVLHESFIFKFDTLGTVTSVVNVTNPNIFSVIVFPNPSSSVFTFWVNNTQQQASLSIYEMNGKLLFSQVLANGSNSCNLSSYQNGHYLYTIINNKGEKLSGKIVKQ